MEHLNCLMKGSLMWKLAMCCAIALAAQVGLAEACQTSSAKIKGSISGNEIEKGTCIVKVEVEETTPDKHCPLKLKVGEEISLKTDFSENDCPDDEGPVEGKVTSMGGKHYLFKGKM
jgi:hypothetical protein